MIRRWRERRKKMKNMEEMIRRYCKRRGLPYDDKILESFSRVIDDAIIRAKDQKRNTLMKRDA